MPSRIKIGSGIGTAGRGSIKIRGFAELFSDLPASAQDSLEGAFSDAEILFDAYQLPTPQRVTRRKISGAVDVPVPVAESSIIGGSVRWPRLKDPRVIMYDVQESDNNIFSSPTETQVIEPFFAKENIITRKFIRVRAVLFGGITGNWSSTVILDPTITAPTAESHGFYLGYYSTAWPDVRPSSIFGANKGPDFYNIWTQDFYQNRFIGGRMVFGYLSNRLKKTRESNVLPWDKVRFLVNGLNIQENEYAHWTTDQFYHPSNSFYAKGGYTASFGPYFCVYPPTSVASGPNSAHTASNFYGEAGEVNFYGVLEGAIGPPWNRVRKIRFPTRVDQGDPTLISQFKGGLEEVAEETYANDLSRQQATTFLKCTDFKFNVPDNTNITGVELQVKRRSLNVDIDVIGDDLGLGPNLHNVLTNAENVDSNDVVFVEKEDIDALNRVFPRSIDFNGNNGATGERLQGPRRVDSDAEEIDITTGDLTLSLWAMPQIGSQFDTNFKLLFNYGFTGATSGWNVILQTLANPTKNLRLNISSGPGPAVREVVYNNPTALEQNVLNHITITYSSSTNVLTLYKNGVAKTPDAVLSAGNPDLTNVTSNTADVLIGGFEGAIPSLDTSWDGIIGQIGMWDTILSEDEIIEIVEAGYEIDLRFPKGSYQSHSNLRHYWLHLFDPPDIRDSEIFLVDKDGDIRSDADNKAIKTESWPKLAAFNADGTSDGIPHDHPIGIGYQIYGGSSDTWGLNLTDGDVNDKDFGVAISAKNQEGRTIGTAVVDNVRMAVYWNDFYRNNVRVQMQAAGLNNFYLEREVFGAIINSIEVGEKLFDPGVSDC
jgi:hypothetical protein